MVRIGIVGIGFMGMIHYLASRGLRDAKVTAICSRDPKKRAGDWRGIRGNFGPPGEEMDLGDIKRYAEVDELLADPDIDLVDICNPTHLHPETAIKALRAGKHVLVEKAIALRSEDAEEMVSIADEEKKLLMVAHVLPFFPEFAYAAGVVRSGAQGRLLGGHFKRVISKPDWSTDIGDAEKTGGPAVDLHIHDTHFIALIAGMPEQIFASGIVSDEGAVDYLTTSYLYGKEGPAITCSSGAIAQKGREFVHGYELYLENATLVYESGTAPLTVLTQDGRSEQPDLEGGTDPLAAFTSELEMAVEGVTSGKLPDLLSGELARDALLLCHRECESVRNGKVLSARS